MAFNAPDPAKQLSLGVFGSLVTEVVPEALAEGVSPDNQDLEFVPGSISSRRCLAKVFSTPFAGNPTYAKSYVAPDGTIYNLYFDTSGAVTVENFTATPGTRTLIYQAVQTTGLYAKSITASGREYIAISDGLRGQEPPLQFDGTFIDRVSQDGPGASPNVQSLALPSTTMTISAAPAVLTVIECDPAGGPSGGPYTAINIFVVSVGSAYVGGTAIIAGSSNSTMDGTYTITAVYPGSGGSGGLIIGSASFSAGTTYGLGGTCTLGYGSTMVRANNTVTVETATPNGLQVGYQVQITGVPAASIGGGISSIVIDNENFPGIATVTTASAHGLSPGLEVSLTGIAGSVVGGTISAIARAGDIVTVTTSAAHGSNPGAFVTIAGVSTASFNTSTTVVGVPNSTQFTYTQVDSDATSSGGTVTLDWPVPASSTPTYYEVQSAPSATIFTVAVSYSDGTWSSGLVNYDWQGTFFVSAVLSNVTFQYQQYGPDATTSYTGTVTPYGQAAPGKHQMQVAFLTRNGAITQPSPPVLFIANGGQYINVTNIPIGPPNVVARILLFTGASGSYFYYIPVPAQVNGQQVSTATQINDNTTTQVLLDFSDNTLYAASATSIPGNNLASQIVIESALGFGSYASRLMAYGVRNIVDNLLNMGFEGGYLPSNPHLPAGWTGPGGTLEVPPNRVGVGYVVGVTGPGTTVILSQSCYQDAYGAPIIQPNQNYIFRCLVATNTTYANLQVGARITSASTGFSSTATVSGSYLSATAIWLNAAFQTTMPMTIPSDMVLEIIAIQTESATVTVALDEMSVQYSLSASLQGGLSLTGIYGSYANNPEAFDGVTGYFGPNNDTRPVMDMGIIRNALYLLTQDPSGRLHQTSDNGITEPAGWIVNQIASNCGVLSTLCLTKSQADDQTGSGGEEWFTWASSTGPRIFGGGDVDKIAQEIQPNWTGNARRGFLGLNFAAAKTIWSVNDITDRVIYFGVPSLDVAGNNTAPNLILPVNYRELDSAYAIANSPPIHTSYTGRLVATDNTRKWTRWNLAFNGAAMMYRGATLSLTFLAGNGAVPGTVTPGYRNVYNLSPTNLTDDDYGQVYPYYVTYAFPSREQEQGLQLGSVRKLLTYVTAFVSGTGTMTLSYLVNTLANVWPLNSQRNLLLNPTRDQNFAGGSATGERFFLKFASSPATGTDNAFNLSKVMASIRPAARLPVSGSAE